MTELYDPIAENRLLATGLVYDSTLAEMLDEVSFTDLSGAFRPAIWQAMGDLHAQGLLVDAAAVLSRCRARGLELDAAQLVNLAAEATGRTWRTHAARVLELSTRRRLIGEAGALEAAARDPLVDPADALDAHLAAVAGAAYRKGELPDDVLTLDAVSREEVTNAPWVVPGLLRQGHRAILVGDEGAGKTWLSAQIAVGASQGLHPFAMSGGQPEVIDPQPVLVLDCENPRDSVVSRFKAMREPAERWSTCYDPSRAFLHHRPGGIDVRRRADVAELQALLREVRPALVVVGPLYKTYRRAPNEGDEDVVLNVQAVWDDLRTQYGFAMLMEAHAPHGSSGNRDRRPFGSSAWLRWPEFGIGLEPKDNASKVLELTRWRGDRAVATWPWQVERGITSSPWPWAAIYR